MNDLLVQEGKETIVSVANFIQYLIGLLMSRPLYLLLGVVAFILVLNRGELKIGKVLKLG